MHRSFATHLPGPLAGLGAALSQGSAPSTDPDFRLIECAHPATGGAKLQHNLLSALQLIWFPALLAISMIWMGAKVNNVQILTVLTGSMEPNLPVGSIVAVIPAPADKLSVEDVITFSPPGRPGDLITHRIIEVQGSGAQRAFITQGDANPAADPWQIPATGTGLRLVFSAPHIGRIFQVVQLPLVRGGLTVIATLGLGSILLVRLWKTN